MRRRAPELPTEGGGKMAAEDVALAEEGMAEYRGMLEAADNG